MSRVTVRAFGKVSAGIATGQCLCGKVQVEISIPAFWAWHDNSRASRRAHGAAYATYVGSWRSRFRVAKGESQLTRFKDEATGDTRAFCSRCGTPVAYTRGQSSKMVARLVRRPHRSPTALSRRHRRLAGMGLSLRTAASVERVSRRHVDWPETPQTPCSVRHGVRAVRCEASRCPDNRHTASHPPEESTET